MEIDELKNNQAFHSLADTLIGEYLRNNYPWLVQGGTTTFQGSFLQTRGFEKGIRGSRLDQFGNVEINNGTIRGTFFIGGAQKTIDNTQDIQTAVDEVNDAGGGTVYLKAGTYTLASDVDLATNVALVGVDRDTVILDCDGSFSVRIVGTFVYSTGTVTIGTGDTEVVGSGTTFTSAMVGSQILLGTAGNFYWYTISAFTDSTHVDIDTAYFGPALSGATFTIADIIVHTTIGNLTVVNGAIGVEAQYAQEIHLDDLYVTECSGLGISIDGVVYPRLFLTASANGTNLQASRMSGFKVDFCDFSNATTGANVVFSNCGDATFFDSVVNGSSSSGVTMSGCDGITFLSVTINSNGSNGVQLSGTSNGNQFIGCSMSQNASDGVEITATSDRNTIISCTIADNGVDGIEILNANCDDNLIGMNQFSGNVVSAVDDSGTGTLIRSNIGEADN